MNQPTTVPAPGVCGIHGLYSGNNGCPNCKRR